MSEKESRLAELDRWKATASHFDPPLGYLVTRCFDVFYYVVRDGIGNDSSVPYSLESLERERQLADGRDRKRSDPLHNLVHGLAEGLAMLVHSIRDDKGADRPEDRQGSHSTATSDHTLPYTDTSMEETKEEYNMDWFTSPDAVNEDQHQPLDTTRIKREDDNDEDDCQILEAEDVASAAAALAASAVDVASAASTADVSVETPSDEGAHDDSRNEETSQHQSDPYEFRNEMEEREEAEDENESEEEEEGGAFACELCSKRFTTNRGLIMHGYTHTGILCAGCNRAMKNQAALDAHIRKVHRPKGQKRPPTSVVPGNEEEGVQKKKGTPPSYRSKLGGPYACDKCDGSFPTANGLMRHQRTHDVAICKYCDRPLPKVYLNNHVKTKHREKWVRQKDSLEVYHEDSPLNEDTADGNDVGEEAEENVEGDYECATCWKRFNSNAELTEHLQTSPGHVKREGKEDASL